jgi:30S ribosomal protein S31
MGKGDKSSKRGKIFAGSYGNVRPKTAAKKAAAPVVAPSKPARAVSKAAPRKKV